MKSHMKTEELLALLRARDQKGLSYLYDHYAPALMGIIIRILSSPKLGEEVLQQTLLKVWDKIETYDENKSTLFTWMSQIARNSAIDQRRLKRFEHGKITDSLDLAVHNKKESNTDTAKIDVEKLLKGLEEKYRTVLDCVYLQGYSHSEASEKLNLPIGTVKTRLRKAILQLREELKVEKGLFIGMSWLMIAMPNLWI